jgi:hypothetical protein
MAIRTTGAEWASESAYVPKPLLQIVQAILWRTVGDFAQALPTAMCSSAQNTAGRRLSKGVRRTMLKIMTG